MEIMHFNYYIYENPVNNKKNTHLQNSHISVIPPSPHFFYLENASIMLKFLY